MKIFYENEENIFFIKYMILKIFLIVNDRCFSFKYIFFMNDLMILLLLRVYVYMEGDGLSKIKFVELIIESVIDVW